MDIEQTPPIAMPTRFRQQIGEDVVAEAVLNPGSPAMSLQVTTMQGSSSVAIPPRAIPAFAQFLQDLIANDLVIAESAADEAKAAIPVDLPIAE